jgi:transposase-like protein
MTNVRAFRGFRFPVEVILWAVRWYLQFPISHRDLERMLADRGVEVDHVSLDRWVQRFAPEFETRMRRHLRSCRGWWHVEVSGRVVAQADQVVRPCGRIVGCQPSGSA